MNHGDIVEQGTHEELLAKEGRYYELWEMQQGNFVIREEEEEQEVIEEMFDENEMSYT